MSNVKQLRRSMKALQRLRSDTRSMVPMEMYHGMGNVLVRTYVALHNAIKESVDDPLVEALVIDLPEDATDRQKVTQVTILVGQLLSFAEDYYEELEAENSEDDTLSEEERVQRRFNDMMDNG